MTARICSIVIALLTAASPALAQTGTAHGEALFKQGVELRSKGMLAEACEAFDASEKADPNLGTLIHLADCREANEQLTTAWAHFLAAEQRTRSSTDDESVQINKLARDRAAKLEPRLSKLTLVVPPASQVPGLEILVGDVSFKANLEAPVDGGKHTITARAPGRVTWKTEITIGVERDTKTVKVPTLAVEAVKSVKDGTTVVIVQEDSSVRRAVPYVLAGAGVVLLGGAIWLESSSRDWQALSKTQPTDAHQLASWENAKKRRAQAIGVGAAGAAVIGVAVVLWLRRDSGSSPSSKSALVQPVVTPDSVGVQLGGAW